MTSASVHLDADVGACSRDERFEKSMRIRQLKRLGDDQRFINQSLKRSLRIIPKLNILPKEGVKTHRDLQESTVRKHFDNIVELKQRQEKRSEWDDQLKDQRMKKQQEIMSSELTAAEYAIEQKQGWRWGRDQLHFKKKSRNSQIYEKYQQEIIAQHVNGQAKYSNLASDQVNKRNLLYNDGFYFQQQDQIQNLDFRKSKLYMYYNQKYKMIERRAQSLVIQSDALQGFRKQEAPAYEDKMAETFKDAYINLGYRKSFKFQMNKSNIRSTFVYKLDMLSRGGSDGIPTTLQRIQDYLRGCEILVEQVKGHVKLFVTDQDPQQFDGRGLQDLSGKTLRDVYLCFEQEKRQQYSQQIEKVALLESTREDTLYSLLDKTKEQYNAAQQKKQSKIQRAPGEQPPPPDHRKQWDYIKMGFDQLEKNQEKDHILVYITLTSLTESCHGTLQIQEKQVHKSLVPLVMSGKLYIQDINNGQQDLEGLLFRSPLIERDANKNNTKFLMNVDIPGNYISFNSYKKSLNPKKDLLIPGEKKKNEVPDFRSSRFLEELEDLVNQRQPKFHKKGMDKVKNLQKMAKKLSSLEAMGNELKEIAVKGISRSQQNSPRSQRDIDQDYMSTRSRRSQSQFSRSYKQEYFSRESAGERVATAKTKRQLADQLRQKIVRIKAHDMQKPFQRSVLQHMQNTVREVRSKKLAVLHWTVIIWTHLLFSNMKKKMIIIRVFMTKSTRMKFSIKIIQRLYRRRLEFDNKKSLTFSKIDEASSLKRVLKYRFKLSVFSMTMANAGMAKPMNRRAKKVFLFFLRSKYQVHHHCEMLRGKFLRMYYLILICQRRFRKSIESYRQKLIDRSLRLLFNLDDLHPPWMVEKMAQATFKLNMKNQLTSKKYFDRFMEKIDELSKRDAAERSLKLQVLGLTGSFLTRFDQLYLRKLYIERLRSSMDLEYHKLDKPDIEISDYQLQTLSSQLTIMDAEDKEINQELDAYFNGRERVHPREADLEDNPFSLHSRKNPASSEHIEPEEPQAHFPWEDIIHMKKAQINEEDSEKSKHQPGDREADKETNADKADAGQLSFKQRRIKYAMKKARPLDKPSPHLQISKQSHSNKPFQSRKASKQLNKKVQKNLPLQKSATMFFNSRVDVESKDIQNYLKANDKQSTIQEHQQKEIRRFLKTNDKYADKSRDVTKLIFDTQDREFLEDIVTDSKSEEFVSSAALSEASRQKKNERYTSKKRSEHPKANALSQAEERQQPAGKGSSSHHFLSKQNKIKSLSQTRRFPQEALTTLRLPQLNENLQVKKDTPRSKKQSTLPTKPSSILSQSKRNSNDDASIHKFQKHRSQEPIVHINIRKQNEHGKMKKVENSKEALKNQQQFLSSQWEINKNSSKAKKSPRDIDLSKLNHKLPPVYKRYDQATTFDELYQEMWASKEHLWRVKKKVNKSIWNFKLEFRKNAKSKVDHVAQNYRSKTENKDFVALNKSPTDFKKKSSPKVLNAQRRKSPRLTNPKWNNSPRAQQSTSNIEGSSNPQPLHRRRRQIQTNADLQINQQQREIHENADLQLNQPIGPAPTDTDAHRHLEVPESNQAAQIIYTKKRQIKSHHSHSKGGNQSKNVATSNRSPRSPSRVHFSKTKFASKSNNPIVKNQKRHVHSHSMLNLAQMKNSVNFDRNDQNDDNQADSDVERTLARATISNRQIRHQRNAATMHSKSFVMTPRDSHHFAGHNYIYETGLSHGLTQRIPEYEIPQISVTPKNIPFTPRNMSISPKKLNPITPRKPTHFDESGARPTIFANHNFMFNISKMTPSHFGIHMTTPQELMPSSRTNVSPKHLRSPSNLSSLPTQKITVEKA